MKIIAGNILKILEWKNMLVNEQKKFSMGRLLV